MHPASVAGMSLQEEQAKRQPALDTFAKASADGTLTTTIEERQKKQEHEAEQLLKKQVENEGQACSSVAQQACWYAVDKQTLPRDAWGAIYRRFDAKKSSLTSATSFQAEVFGDEQESEIEDERVAELFMRVTMLNAQSQAVKQARPEWNHTNLIAAPHSYWAKLHAVFNPPEPKDYADPRGGAKALPNEGWAPIHSRFTSCRYQVRPSKTEKLALPPCAMAAIHERFTLKARPEWNHTNLMAAPCSYWAKLHAVFKPPEPKAKESKEAKEAKESKEPAEPKRRARPGKNRKKWGPCTLLPPLLGRNSSREKEEMGRSIASSCVEDPRAAGGEDLARAKFVPKTPHGPAPTYRRPQHPAVGPSAGDPESEQEKEPPKDVHTEALLPPVPGATPGRVEEHGAVTESSGCEGLLNTERCTGSVWRKNKLGRHDEKPTGGIRFWNTYAHDAHTCTLNCACGVYSVLNEKMVRRGTALALGSPGRRTGGSTPRKAQAGKTLGLHPAK